MKKLILVPFLIALACLLAAGMGAAQNQLTYGISPSWFHDWKFEHFAIPEALHGRLGASLVGVLATWWMGLILSVVLLGVCLFARSAGAMAGLFIQSAVLVVLITALAEFGAWIWGLYRFGPETVPGWASFFEDPVAAARVEFINFTGYCAAPAGTLAAVGRAMLRLRRVG